MLHKIVVIVAGTVLLSLTACQNKNLVDQSRYYEKINNPTADVVHYDESVSGSVSDYGETTFYEARDELSLGLDYGEAEDLITDEHALNMLNISQKEAPPASETRLPETAQYNSNGESGSGIEGGINVPIDDESAINKALSEAQVSSVDEVILIARSYVHTPYLYGGQNYKGIDCSALVQNSFNGHVNVPRTAADQAEFGVARERDAIQKGDVLFFTTDASQPAKVNHSGIVLSTDDNEVRFVHASESRGVIISSLSNTYWSKRFQLARQYIK